MRVLKIGGRVQRDPRLVAAIAAAWAARPGALCVVHGGGDEISALQKQLGLTPRFIGGRRVTSALDIDVIRMALSGTANKRLVAALVGAGVRAVGLSGEDGGFLRAVPVDRDAMGEVGTPSHVDAELLHVLTRAGFLPVLSPLARGHSDGEALNVNGDDAAAAIAIALEATELVFVADVPGVQVGGRALTTLDDGEAQALVARGEATGGMQAKLEAAFRALRGGVAQVRIGDLHAITDDCAGTRLHEHEASLA